MKKIKRILAATLAVMICCVALINPANSGMESAYATPVDTQISEYEQKIRDLEKQADDLQQKMNNNKNNINSEKENQKLLDSQIQTTLDNIALRNSYLSELEDDIAKLDEQIYDAETDIEERQVEIDGGIEDFGKRLRAMYISGSGGYTEVVLDSGDFYDTLMRVELVKRVADNDNKFIDNLIDLRKQQEAKVVALENSKQKISTAMTNYNNEITELETEREKLEDLYKKSEKSVESLQDFQEKYLKQQEQLNKDTSKTENKLDELNQKKLLEELEAKLAREAAAAAAEEAANKNNNNNNGSTGPSGGGANVGSGDGGSASIDDNVTYEKNIQPVLNMARSMVGGSYVWGAASPTASDCSGLTLQCYAKIGIRLPHKASMQANYGRAVSYGEMKPGDLIFYGGSSYSSIYHVAIYIGNGKIIHAESTRTGIVVSNSASVASRNHVTVIKRLVE